MLQTRSDEECSILQHHLMSETIVRTNLPKKQMLYLLDVWIWEAQWADDNGGPSGDCCSAALYSHSVSTCSSSIWTCPLQVNSAFVQNGVIRAKRFHGNLSAGLEAHRWSARSRDGGQIKIVISNMPLLDWRGIHTGTCYRLMISPKERLEALTGTQISHLTTQLQSWLHHKPANMAVVDVKNWPGMCTIPALDVVCDSQENLFMFLIILTSCQPAWLKSVTGWSCQCAQHSCMLGSILGG